MNFTKKVKFLNQCEENINKLGFYLDLSDKDLSCGPCLILKRYYKWTLKYIYNADILEEDCESYFLNIIDKLDYKVIANMEYEDFRDLLLAYFSLGEIYYNEANLQLAKEYFLKAAEMMEESLKAGNKYQTEEIQEKIGVVFFEILMWARKNLGDMEEGAEALELYESIIGEEECLYVEKHSAIFKTAKELKLIAIANDAARSVMKISSTYKGINNEVVEFLIQAKEYENALEIATAEYIKNDITHWINIVNIICREADELNAECVHKVISFLNLLIGDFKIVDWSTIAYTLYMNVRGIEPTQVIVLDYLRQCFNKVKRNDFSACGQVIMVLKNIYEDIRIEKYENDYLRQYEFDFTLYLMNTAVQNQSFEKGLESSAKLKAIIEVANVNKDIYPYVEQCLEICKENINGESYALDAYPWNYLYDNLKVLTKKYGIDDTIKTLDIARNGSNKMIIGICNLDDEKIASIINEGIGESIFYKHKDIVLVTSSSMEVEAHIKEKYSYEIIVKEGLLKNNSCIMTYENSALARLTDLNIIVIDGHRELRDMDITYMRHILQESLKNKVLILFNSESEEFSEGSLSYNETMIKTLLNFENIEFLDMKKIRAKKDVISFIVKDVPDSIVKHKFDIFNKDILDSLNYIKEDIKAVKAEFKEKRYIISECGREYSYIEEELSNNHKEFSLKVNKDIEFLRQYAGDKIASVIPDLLQTRFVAIDDLEDVANLKEKAEEILSRSVESWCTKNIYKLMLEQFQVYIAKYSKYYSFQEETLDRIEENRKTLISSYPEFAENIMTIEIKQLDEIIQEFLVNYESYLQSINYRVTIIPNENLFSAMKDGIKVMFLKNEEKAENLRTKIKTLVLENVDNISKAVVENIEEKLGFLQEKLQEIINGIFQGAKECTAREKATVENAIKTLDEEYAKIEAKNTLVEAKMEFIEVEALKYSIEVATGVVYSEDKCYCLN
ncbi:ring-infected erythrocyte surface antigen domain-containing protein [Clostridium culturomicium]|uniref:hypothetical protein n=1 Tax=Clostridium culturomicium TaxID=1499683 RepID=UPI00058E9299|nr:hypothetical protein [Clostridium culturomicium]